MLLEVDGRAPDQQLGLSSCRDGAWGRGAARRGGVGPSAAACAIRAAWAPMPDRPGRAARPQAARRQLAGGGCLPDPRADRRAVLSDALRSGPASTCWCTAGGSPAGCWSRSPPCAARRSSRPQGRQAASGSARWGQPRHRLSRSGLARARPRDRRRPPGRRRGQRRPRVPPGDRGRRRRRAPGRHHLRPAAQQRGVTAYSVYVRPDGVSCATSRRDSETGNWRSRSPRATAWPMPPGHLPRSPAVMQAGRSCWRPERS